jgi:hypothetical protein
MANTRDIVAEIKADIPRPRTGRWHDRLTTDQQAMVDVIAAAWVAGQFGPAARAVAPAIAKKLKEAGIHVTPYTVREWLGGLNRS